MHFLALLPVCFSPHR
ncbi:hypothetical protein [African swine fever virus]